VLACCCKASELALFYDLTREHTRICPIIRQLVLEQYCAAIRRDLLAAMAELRFDVVDGTGKIRANYTCN